MGELMRSSVSPATRPRGRWWPVALAAVSAMVLLACGAGWVSLHRQGSADVITATPAATRVIRAGGEQNVLLVGLDTRTDAHGNPLPLDQLAALHAGNSSDGGDNTDTVIVIHVPADGGAATAFSIPRDSYVALAGDFGTHVVLKASDGDVEGPQHVACCASDGGGPSNA